MTSGNDTNNANDSGDPPPSTGAPTSNDTITRWFSGMTIVWGLVTSLAGLVVGYALLDPTANLGFGSAGEWLSYGRIRPVFALVAVYGFAANAAFTAIYYTTQRLCKTRIWSDFLATLHFVAWQALVVIGAITIPTGATQGKQFAEAEWPVDAGFAIVWLLFFAVNFFATLATRRQKQLYISIWFYIATILSFGVYQTINAAISIVGDWESVPLLGGTYDALLHSVWVNNTVMALLIMPFLGLIYYFAPKSSGRPIYSYRLAVAQFWGMIFCFYWVGPAQLHLTAIPDWASSLAMVFGLMLWMPLWGGVVNGLKTLASPQENPNADADSKLLATGVRRFLKFGTLILGLAVFSASLTSIKSISAVLNFTQWPSAQLDAMIFGACGMLSIGMIYWLIPKIFQAKPFNESLIGLHFWLSAAGVVITVIAGFAGGIWQGLSMSALNPNNGMLEFNEYLPILTNLTSLWWLRLAGLALFAAGMLIMTLNFFVTAISRVGKCESCQLGDAIAYEPTLNRAKSKYAEVPMLDFAKSIEHLRTFDWHRFWERDVARFVFIPLIVMLVVTFVQLGPMWIPSSVPHIASVQPYTPLELTGREIFLREGCVNCHTQVVRATVPEVERFGELSQPGEFAYDYPSQWGHRRIGPDLAREGGRKTSHWHWFHLRDPRNADWFDPGSVMPSFAHLSVRELDDREIKAALEKARKSGVEYSFEPENAPEVARQQAERIAAEVVGGGGPIWTERNNGQEPLMVFDSQAVALIAYLQRLGTDLFKPAPVKNPLPTVSAN